MTPEIVDDLKQFIQAAFVQYGSEITERLDRVDVRLDRVETRIDKLDAKVDALEVNMDAKLDALEEKIDTKLDVILDAVHERFEDHEQRIVKLETAAA